MRRVYARAVRLRTQLLVLLAAFVGATVVAELAGASNLGTALAFGQMAFVVALVIVLLRG
ncbi:MAG: hypothetical protein QOK25_447 [Thermoleophilaceae bacterium]|nr:hypothetical protein [Thermoleophilaceae bacterium]